jgi:hypothetical protein
MRTAEQVEAKLLREGVEVRIRRLRALVDDIERQATAALNAAVDGNGAYGSVAEVFVKELAQGTTNVAVENLIYTATRADIYAAEDKNQED